MRPFVIIWQPQLCFILIGCLACHSHGGSRDLHAYMRILAHMYEPESEEELGMLGRTRTGYTGIFVFIHSHISYLSS